MFSRKMILSATLLAGLSGLSPALAESPGAAAAKPAAMAASGIEFSTEADAKAHCPADKIVWGNLTSKAYHLSGSPHYGKTKRGAYLCQADADANGFHKAGTRHAAAAGKKPS